MNLRPMSKSATKSMRRGFEGKFFEDVLHMRLEEAFAQLSEIREDILQDQAFNDISDESFILFKNALKESDKFAWMPNCMLFDVSYIIALTEINF